MPGKAWTTEDDQCLVENVGKLKVEEICELLGRSERAVFHRMQKFGLRSRIPMRVGEKVNKLTLLQTWVENRGSQNWTKGLFECECKRTIKVAVSAVRRGVTKDCGCSWKSKLRTICRSKTTHGLSGHPMYHQYKGMIARCTYPSMPDFYNYGGRGIAVCDAWKNDFMTFFNWAMGHGWERGLTIERKDVNGNYCPENCVLATCREQGNNKRNNRMLTVFGETKTLAEWSRDKRCRTNYIAILNRIDKLGWGHQKAITTPTRKLNRVFK